MNTNFTKCLSNVDIWFCMPLAFIPLFFISSCSSDDTSVDCSMVNISVSASAINSGCPDPTGSITITASGGGANLEYSIDGQSFQSSNTFENLNGGDYTVTVRDADGCSANAEVMLESVSDITFTAVTGTAAGCGGNDGTLSIIASGGDGNFQFSIDDGSFQDSNQFDNLANGLHTVTIRDGSDCEVTGEGYVASGISYSAQVSTIVSTYCAVSGCHVAGAQQPNLSVFANVQSAASEIRSRTQSGSMPRGSTLTDEQIAAIACWVDDGALNN